MKAIKLLYLVCVASLLIFNSYLPISAFAETQRQDLVSAGASDNYTYTLQGLIYGEDPSLESSWTTGNVCQGGGGCYAEGDNVPSRLKITGLTSGSSYSVVTQHDYMDGDGKIGYKNFNRTSPLPADINASGISISYQSPDVQCGSDFSCKNYNLSFTALDEESTIYWNSLLGLDAADWNGASLHFRLESGIGGENVGNKEVPIQVRQILFLPSLTLTKIVDIGDATPDLWYFNVSPAINNNDTFYIPTGESSITIENVPEGSYTITENGGIAGYQFSGNGPNTNCVFEASIATASVAPGDPASNGLCSFHNSLTTGTVIVHKDVQGPNGENILDTNPNFSVNLDGNDNRSITDEGIVTYNNVPAGEHTVLESFVPEGYGLYSVSPDQDGNPENGSQFYLEPGETKDIFIINRQKNAVIRIIKDVIDPEGNQVEDNHEFTISLDGDNQQFAEGFDAIFEVIAGFYNIYELFDPDYKLVIIYPDDDLISEGAQINVSPGEEIVVTVINQQKKATINVIKDVISPNGEDIEDSHNFYVKLNGENEKTINEATQASYQVNPGTGFSITEKDDPNYEELGCFLPSGELAENFSLLSNQTVSVICKNKQQYSTVTVIKDVRLADGSDIGDNTSFTVERDGNDNKQFSEENNALYTLPPGNYHFAEQEKQNYTLHSITPDNNSDPKDGTMIKLLGNENITITFVNYRHIGRLIIEKDVIPDDDSSWDFELWQNEDKLGTTTLSDGESSEAKTLITGAYSIIEKGHEGTNANNYTTSFGCTNQDETIVASGEGRIIEELVLHNEEEIRCKFTNSIKKGTIIVEKYNDINRNGYRDGREPTMEGWEIDLSGIIKTTDENGLVIFDNLLPNEYTLGELLKDDWTLSNISCGREEETDNNNNHLVSVGPGEEVYCQIGNYYQSPYLLIEKTNNRLGENLLAGSSVIYTIYITAKDNNIYNAMVRDTLPDGFQIIQDSSEVVSSIRGEISVAEPSYANGVGLWPLGKIEKDEVITINYTAKISQNQEPGLYKDNAWAKGLDIFEEEILATSGEIGKINDNFVGTAVNVVEDVVPSDIYQVEQEKTNKKIILEDLPQSGPNILALLLTGVLIFFLLLALMVLPKKKKIIRSLTSLFIISLIIFSFSSFAMAAGLNIRLEEPKSPTKENIFKINFVVLDILDRDTNVKCYKKGPGDPVFSQFGPAIAINSGTANCDLAFSPLTMMGIYQFKVRAESLSPNEIVESNIASVEYITEKPGDPTNYQKTRNGCNYTIKFKTANDGGKTSRVEIYMSENKTFDINAITRVKNIAIGSNTEAQETIVAPDCNKDYYFAIRSFDDAGNSSGLVGDREIVLVELVERISRLVGREASETTLTSSSAGITSEEGEVAGEETSDEISAQKEEQEENGEVAGEETSDQEVDEKTEGSSTLTWVAGIVAILIIAGGVIVQFLRKKGTEEEL